MSERRVIQIAVLITALLSVFILGFALGKDPESEGVLLISSVENVENTSINVSSAEAVEITPVENSDPLADLRIDINTATAEDFVLLPGIGEKTAVNIITYRESVENFLSIDELLNVDGIGEKKLEDIRPYLYIEETP